MGIFMIYCGIDYSYGCPAMAFWNSKDPLTFDNIRFYAYYTVKKYCAQIRPNILIMEQPKYSCPEERFHNIAKWSEAVLLTEKPDVITLEGYAMGNSKNSNNICQTAENTSLLKQALYRHKMEFEIVTPTYVKKNFTGKGNSDKLEMIKRFEALFNVNMRGIMDMLEVKDPKPIDDLVDGFANMVASAVFIENYPNFNRG